MKITLSVKARQDLLLAVDYYTEINADLAQRFEAEVESAFQSLAVFWKYEIKYRDTRIYRLRNFPYCLYYVVYEEFQELMILACIHERALPTLS